MRKLSDKGFHRGADTQRIAEIILNITSAYLCARASVPDSNHLVEADEWRKFFQRGRTDALHGVQRGCIREGSVGVAVC